MGFSSTWISFSPSRPTQQLSPTSLFSTMRSFHSPGCTPAPRPKVDRPWVTLAMLDIWSTIGAIYHEYDLSTRFVLFILLNISVVDIVHTPG